MDFEFQELEVRLKAMRPVGLDDELMSRLEAAVGGRLQRVEDELRPMEAVLSKMVPAAVQEGLKERLSGVLEKVPFPVDEKVVLFPRGSKRGADAREGKSGKWWMSAAAVAVIGGFTALMVSPRDEGAGKVVVENSTTRSPVMKTQAGGSFVPAAFGSGVSDTEDMGVMWSENQKPVRVVRVIYKDQVHFINEAGQRVSMEIPRAEYLVVPEKID